MFRAKSVVVLFFSCLRFILWGQLLEWIKVLKKPTHWLGFSCCVYTSGNIGVKSRILGGRLGVVHGIDDPACLHTHAPGFWVNVCVLPSVVIA